MSKYSVRKVFFILTLSISLFFTTTIYAKEQINIKEKELYFQKAIEYVSLNDFDLALKQFEKSIKIDPNFAEGYLGIGFVYRKMGKFNLSIKYLKKSLDLDPSMIDSYDNLGIAYIQQKNYKEAISIYLKAIENNYLSDSIYYNLSCAYSLSKNKDLSLDSLDKALILNPKFKLKALKDKDLDYIKDTYFFKKITDVNY
ncbi:MAG: tetratricopeptide repeat protein [Candidatus Sericytochromatia bacterium]